MSLQRVLLFVLFAGIVAAAAAAVYLLWGRDDGEHRVKFAGIDNFIAAREILPASKAPFLDAQSVPINLDKFRGKVVVLNLWATWCTPCVAEMPMLDRLQQQLRDLDVVVVALSIDSGGPATVKAFYEEHGIKHLAVYVDPSMRAQSEFRVIGLPTTILIDRQGRDRGRIVGPAEWDDAAAADLVLSASR